MPASAVFRVAGEAAASPSGRERPASRARGILARQRGASPVLPLSENLLKEGRRQARPKQGWACAGRRWPWRCRWARRPPSSRRMAPTCCCPATSRPASASRTPSSPGGSSRPSGSSRTSCTRGRCATGTPGRDSGKYTCFVKNPKEKGAEHNATITLAVVVELEKVDKTLTKIIAAVVGGVIGLLVLILVAKKLILFALKKRKEKTNECLVSSSGNDNTENGLAGSKADQKSAPKA
ncbi:sodium channel subunit beta-4 isoform X1 [Sphaerodactylus townsendi]|uniref:sodium channel subunit beta-4 isoform X1 n=1 Tax=Sphaerodactylus townsendi TaxID=933632 RepID=UPI002025E630|nr:sodium channel subunit beta-4 isoform X1 [Sphaerodactylus townsendi]